MKAITEFSKSTFEGKLYTETLYKIEIKKIIKIQNWKYNRPLNTQKVNEIVETIKGENHTPTPLLGYLIVDEDKNIIKEVFVYDGGHRLAAYKLLVETNELHKVLNGYVFIQGCVNPTFEYIKNKFKIINKLTPVSELYSDMNDPNEMIKYQKYIDGFGNAFQKKYNKNSSTANNPHAPNYNKYHVQEDFRVISLEHDTLIYMEITEILELFHNLNEYYKNMYNENYDEYNVKTKKCIDKASKVECFLFVKGRNKWKDDITRFI